MKKYSILGQVAVGALALTAAVSGVIAMNSNDAQAPPEIPANPAVELPLELVHVQPFELAESAIHYWRSEQPSYTSGLIVVLQGDPAFLDNHQVADPVIYVGDQTVERLNNGSPSGMLVAVVPGVELADLADTPIYFGQPALPEQVGADQIAAELDAAVASGLVGPGQARVDLASSDPIGALDHADLLYQASFLIEKYSATETDLISGLRVERLDL